MDRAFHHNIDLGVFLRAVNTQTGFIIIGVFLIQIPEDSDVGYAFFPGIPDEDAVLRVAVYMICNNGNPAAAGHESPVFPKRISALSW